jgi:hypothetical protein
LKRILADWQSRKNRTRTSRYVMAGEKLTPKGSFNDWPIPGSKESDVPMVDHAAPIELTLLLDSTGKRIRKERREQIFYFDRAVFIPRYAVQVFDGESTKIYMPRKDNENENYKRGFRDPDLGIVRNRAEVPLDPFDYPVFFAQGIVPTWKSGLHADHLHATPASSDLQVHGAGTLNGRSCIIVRSSPSKDELKMFDEFWIDLPRESAVVRADRYVRAQLSYRIDTRYHKTDYGWLPASWTVTEFDMRHSDKFWLSATLQVKEVEIDGQFSPGLFDFELKPGMVVTYYNNGNGSDDPRSIAYTPPVDFHVAPDGHTLIPITGDDSIGNQAWWIWLVQFLVVCAALAVLGCFWLRRRWNRLASRPLSNG